MGTIIRNRHWRMAIASAARYMLFNVLTAFSAWLVSVKGNWPDVGSWEVVYLVTSLSLTALGTLGAIMNDKWSTARKGTTDAQ